MSMTGTLYAALLLSNPKSDYLDFHYLVFKKVYLFDQQGVTVDLSLGFSLAQTHK